MANIMGMPIRLDVDDRAAADKVFALLRAIDAKFSTYKDSSEVSKIRRGELFVANASQEVRDVVAACDEWSRITKGYFDAYYDGNLDPSGYVKGWALWRAEQLLVDTGSKEFLLDAGGDIVAAGKDWKVGIRLPDDSSKMACTLALRDLAIATSGLYERGQHIVDPITKQKVSGYGSISVIGPDIITADVLATTFFAMGEEHQSEFSDLLPVGYDLYIITKDGFSLFTPGIADLRLS